jgi:hypothetical protein
MRIDTHLITHDKHYSVLVLKHGSNSNSIATGIVIRNICQPMQSPLLLLRNADLLQNIIESNPRPTRNDRGPDVFRESLIFREDAPVRTRFRFEPFEIVNLVPLVAHQVL